MTTQGETNNAGAGGEDATGPGVRASDVDRLATVRVLQDAVARGLLTPDEGSERMAAAFAAVHLSQLDPLTADLPAGTARVTAPGWRPLATMAVAQVRSSLRAPASGRVTPARIAVVLVVAFLLLMAVGSLVGEVFFDGGFDRGGFDGDRFGRD